MTGTQRVGDLEVSQDLHYHRRAWRVQRFGWVAMLVVIVAALSGLFGRGPLSRTTAADADGRLRLEYNRFERFRAPTTVRLRVTPGSRGQTEARVWLSRSFLDGVQIERVTPEPDGVASDGERITYVFRTSESGSPVSVTFHLQMEQIGALVGQAGLSDGTVLDFRQFVYP